MIVDDSDVSFTVDNIDINCMNIVKINGERFVKQSLKSLEEKKKKTRHETMYAKDFLSIGDNDKIIVLKPDSKWEVTITDNIIYRLKNRNIEIKMTYEEAHKYFTFYKPTDGSEWDNAKFNGEY